MSYCRWSCDGHKSDVYCYAHVSGGFTTHVATCRYEVENPPEPSFENQDEWLAWYKEVRGNIAGAKLVDIGLPHDGETFSDETLAELRTRLEHLQSLGYHVPKHAFERINREIEETQLTPIDKE